MKPEEIYSLFVSLALIEETYDLTLVCDFLKINQAVKVQEVKYGHFLKLIENQNDILFECIKKYEKTLFEERFLFFNQVNTLLSINSVTSNSLLGIIAMNYSSMAENISLSNWMKNNKDYVLWKHDISQNVLFSLIDPDFLLGFGSNIKEYNAFPSYITDFPSIDKLESELESVNPQTPNSLLLLAVIHALNRKTAKAIQESSELSLKLSVFNDATTRLRAATLLSQIYRLIGMTNESELSIKETIDSARTLNDQSVLSTAVALNASISNSPGYWNHAASLPEPHPEAIIMAKIEKNATLSDILKLEYPLVAVRAYTRQNIRFCSQLVELLPVNYDNIARKVYFYALDANWSSASRVLLSQDLSIIEVRASACALAVLYYEMYDNDELRDFYHMELMSILEIGLNSITIIKETLLEMINVMQYEVKSPIIPIDQCVIKRLLWMSENQLDSNSIKKCKQLCIKYGAAKIYKKIAKDDTDINIPFPRICTYEIEHLLNELL